MSCEPTCMSAALVLSRLARRCSRPEAVGARPLTRTARLTPTPLPRQAQRTARRPIPAQNERQGPAAPATPSPDPCSTSSPEKQHAFLGAHTRERASTGRTRLPGLEAPNHVPSSLGAPLLAAGWRLWPFVTLTGVPHPWFGFLATDIPSCVFEADREEGRGKRLAASPMRYGLGGGFHVSTVEASMRLAPCHDIHVRPSTISSQPLKPAAISTNYRSDHPASPPLLFIRRHAVPPPPSRTRTAFDAISPSGPHRKKGVCSQPNHCFWGATGDKSCGVIGCATPGDACLLLLRVFAFLRPSAALAGPGGTLAPVFVDSG